MISAPPGSTMRGPNRSSRMPITGAESVHMTDPSMSAPDASPRLQRNSSITATKNTAKALRVPNATATVKNAMPMTTHG